MTNTAAPQTLDGRQVVAGLARRHRREWQPWVIGIVAVYIIAVLLNFLIFNDSWKWELVGAYLLSERIVGAVLNTVGLTVLSLAGGLLLGLLTCYARLSDIPVLRISALVYIWLVRAIPPLAILLLIYFLGALTPTLGVGLPFLPYIVEWPTNSLITPFSAAILGLSFYLGGKSAEIFRSGLLAVEQGQREAVKALGLSPETALVRVIGPQAIRVIVPPMSNEVVTMFKNTSLVSVVGYAELLTTTQRIYSVNFETIPMLTVACIWYLALTSLLMAAQLRIERKFGRGFARSGTKKVSNRSQQRASDVLTHSSSGTPGQQIKGEAQ